LGVVGSVRLGEDQVNNPIDFRTDAVECLRLADRVEARQHKTLLVDLARAWISLAEQAEDTRAEDTRAEHARAGHARAARGRTQPGPAPQPGAGVEDVAPRRLRKIVRLDNGRSPPLAPSGPGAARR